MYFNFLLSRRNSPLRKLPVEGAILHGFGDVLAEELGYLTRDDLTTALAISDEVGRLLNGVISALHRRLNRQPAPTSNL